MTTVRFQEVRTRRTFEEVVSQVRELLFGGSLKPGDRLPAERELATHLGIGRPALREALRALETAGLIDLRKGKTGGAFISSGKQSVVSESMSDMLRLANVSVHDFFEVRFWIQAGLARTACQRATPADIERLRLNVLEAKRLHKAGKNLERMRVNVEFHNMLAETTGNQVAIILIRALTDALMSLSRELGSYPAPGYFEDRMRLVEAIARRNEKDAEIVMERILKTAMRVYKHLEEKRDAAKAAPTPSKFVKQTGPSSKTRAAR